MGRATRFVLIGLTLGPVAVAAVVVGPPAELADRPPAWFASLEYPGPGTWEWLLKAEDDSAVWFYAPRNAVQPGEGISAWRRIEFRDPQPAVAVTKLWTGAYLGLVEQVDINCDSPAERRRAAHGFRGRNMTDPIEPTLALDASQSRWQPALPGTASAVFVSRVCAASRSRGMNPY